MDKIAPFLPLVGDLARIIMEAIANRNADIEASRVKFVSVTHEFFNALRDLRASEKADHDAAVKAHLDAMVNAAEAAEAE